MPMCDVSIPAGALLPDVEDALLARVNDILVGHELRRTADLTDEPVDMEASRKRANNLSWMLLHRPEIFVAGKRRSAPSYRFEVYVPEGQADDEFRKAVTRDVTQAVVDAEAGAWPHPEVRVWVFTFEIPEGSWGAVGRINGLRDVVAWVTPELADLAVQRLEAERRSRSRALIEAAAMDDSAIS